MRWLFVAFALLLALCAPASAQTDRLVVLVVPGLKSADLSRPEVPALQALAARSAVGWMNARTARVPGAKTEPEEAAYLTLGAGSRATAGPWARTLDAAVLARLKAANARLDHYVPIGALGELVHRSGAFTAVIGNEDDTAPRRAAVLMPMDAQGRVDRDGTGTAALVRNAAAPYGLEANLDAYRLLPGRSLQVWVFGDLARADRYAPLCLPAMADRHRAGALRRLDQLLTTRLLPLPSDVRLVLLAPCAADSAPVGDRLAPVLWAGEDVRPGLLSSGSAHIPGLVTNTDFLPSALYILGGRIPLGGAGRPVRSIDEPVDARGWAALHDRWAARAAQQAALGGLPTVQFAGVLLVLFIAWLVGGPIAARLAAGVALAILALPLALLVLPLSGVSTVWGAALLLALALAAALAVGALWPAKALRLGTGLAAVLALVSLADLLTGAHLMQGAWMSYSIMEGARYYGIGNEYCGALLVAALLAALSLRGRPHTLGVAGLLLLALLIGLPQLGANAGGCLGTLVGFGVAALVWWRGRLRARDVALALGAAIFLLAVLLAVDLMRETGEQTHIARAITSGASLGNIVARKAELNAYLLTHSPWALALLVALVGLWLRGRELAVRIVEDAGVRGAAVGVAAGTLALLLFNDSGVVAAAEALLMAWAAAVLLAPVGQAAGGRSALTPAGEHDTIHRSGGEPLPPSDRPEEESCAPQDAGWASP